MSVQQLGFSVASPAACVAAVGTVAGLLDTSAVYGYKVTFVTGFGETAGGANAAVTTNSSGSVALSSIPVSANGSVFARNIYRTEGGGAAYLLLTTLNDNTTTEYSDIIADAALGAAMPGFSTADSLQHFAGTVKIDKPLLKSVGAGITAGAGGTSAAAVQLSNEINIIATVATINDSVKLPGLNASLIGTFITVKNLSANTARIYPFDGQEINLGGADVAVTIATTVALNFVAETASNWRQI